MSDRFIVFDIWGDYAHFRKYYTTSSPLTFSIPPRTALIGLVGAILGLEKDVYLAHMVKDKATVAVRVLSPIKKVRMGQNLVDTKGGYWRPVPRGNLTGRTQIRFEFLKDPKFRVYFSHTEKKVAEDLFAKLTEHKSVFTPCLGLSELICNFSVHGQLDVKENVANSEFLDVVSAVPLDLAEEVDFEQPGKKFFKERLPAEMLPDRVVTEYREVIYEAQGQTIRARLKNALTLENSDVITPL